MKKIHFIFFLCSFILLFLSNLVIAMPIYSYTDLGNWSTVSINDRGTIVGNDGGSIILYQDGVVSNLGSFGGRNSTSVSDINNNNQIVGKYFSDEGTHAFQYKNGLFTDLHDLVSPIYSPIDHTHSNPLQNSSATGINDKGQIVFNTLSFQAINSYVYESGTVTELGQWDVPSPENNLGYPWGVVARAINNKGQIVGSGETGNGAFPVFLWDENPGLEWIITDTPRVVTDINDAGQIVGHGGTSSTGPDQYAGAWIWQDGVIKELIPDDEFSSVNAINNSGMMVGSDSDGNSILIYGDEIIDMSALGSPGVDINNFGEIIGTQYIDTDNDGISETHAFLLTPEWDKVTTDQFYLSDIITLEDIFRFDIWWDLGLEPTNFNLDILAFFGEGAEVFGFDINWTGSSLDWETLEFDIPEWARGRDAQIIYTLADLGQTTDPTVYLRNICSVSASVPEPSTILLMALGLPVLVFADRRKKQTYPANRCHCRSSDGSHCKYSRHSAPLHYQ